LIGLEHHRSAFVAFVRVLCSCGGRERGGEGGSGSDESGTVNGVVAVNSIQEIVEDGS